MRPEEAAIGQQSYLFRHKVDEEDLQGVHTVSVELVDPAGNLSHVRVGALRYDFTPPTLAHSSVVPALARGGQEVTITLNTDEPLAAAPQLVAEKLPGLVPELIAGQAGDTLFRYLYQVPLPEEHAGDEDRPDGTYPLVASFLDQAGNRSPRDVFGILEIDTRAPRVLDGWTVETSNGEIQDREEATRVPARETILIRFCSSEALLDEPEVRIGAFGVQDCNHDEQEPQCYTCEHETRAAEGSGHKRLTVTLQDAAGNMATGELALLEYDIEAPGLVEPATWHHVKPPRGCVLRELQALGRGSVSELFLTATERLSEAPAVWVVLPQGGRLEYQPLPHDDGMRSFAYDLPLPEQDDVPLDGPYEVRARLTDEVGNEAEPSVVMTPLFNVDTTLPPSPNMERIRYIRDKWGSAAARQDDEGAEGPSSPCSSGLPCFSVKGVATAAEPFHWIALWSSEHVGPQRLAGVGQADGDGAFWIESPEVFLAYATQLDRACNHSLDQSGGAEPVLGEEWVATFGGKVEGSPGENPHMLAVGADSSELPVGSSGWREATEPGRLALPDGSLLVHDNGRKARELSWRAWPREDAAGIDADTFPAVYDSRRGMVVSIREGDDEGLLVWEWSASGWAQRSAGSGPDYRRSFSIAYDSRRGRVLLFGGAIFFWSLCDLWVWEGAAWTEVEVSDEAPSPADCWGASMAYDSRRDRVVLFGGVSGGESSSDLWEWDGVAWSERACQPDEQWPDPRNDYRAAYDEARGRVVIFGGESDEDIDASVWEWDGQSWTRVPPPEIGPCLRSNPAMVYDSLTRRVMLFGGLYRQEDDDDVYMDDLWEWDGRQWTLRAGPGSGPAGRWGAGMAHDPHWDRLVLLGGQDASDLLDDTWLWDGERWAEVGTRPSGLGPRAGHAAAYDTRRGLSVVFGGADGDELLADTWRWDGLSWTPGPEAPGGLTPRRDHAMAFHAARGELVLFGGEDGEGLRSDTWLLDVQGWHQHRPDPPGGPSPRAGAAMAHDPVRQEVLLFGGDDGSLRNDTWTFDGEAWRLRPAPPDALSPRKRSALACDPVLGQCMLFGGEDGDGLRNDTWLWDGQAWQLAEAEPSPELTERAGHALVYDGSRQAIILAGGSAGDVEGGCNGSGSALCGDAWTWREGRWSLDPGPQGEPGPRGELMAVYDAARQQVLILSDSDGEAGSDIWLANDLGGLPQQRVRFEWTIPYPVAVEGLDLRIIGGGRGLDASQEELPGFAASVWGHPSQPQAWFELEGSPCAAGLDADPPGTLAYSTDDAHEIEALLVTGGLELLATPLAARGLGPRPAAVGLDYVELRVRYRR